MSDKTKSAIEELAKAADGNPTAKAFLDGLKHGLLLNRQNINNEDSLEVGNGNQDGIDKRA